MPLEICQKIHETKVISIVRGVTMEQLVPTIDALYEGGIRCVEITMDNHKALSMIEKTKDLYGDKMLVGAGTVLDTETARSTILAGADFVLAPTLDVSVIEMCNTYNKLAVPGVFTATEALTAWKAGAKLIKVFPVTSVGPSYIKDVLGPLKQLRLLPVGGVGVENAADYIKAGAYAVGVGSSIVNKKEVEAMAFENITKKAKMLIENVAKASGK